MKNGKHINTIEIVELRVHLSVKFFMISFFKMKMQDFIRLLGNIGCKRSFQNTLVKAITLVLIKYIAVNAILVMSLLKH